MSIFDLFREGLGDLEQTYQDSMMVANIGADEVLEAIKVDKGLLESSSDDPLYMYALASTGHLINEELSSLPQGALIYIALCEVMPKITTLAYAAGRLRGRKDRLMESIRVSDSHSEGPCESPS